MTPSTMHDTELSEDALNVSFMLEHFLREVYGVEQVIGVSSDGLLMALAAPMDRGEADKLAAAISGVSTLALSACRLMRKGGLTQVITECEGGYLVASMITGRACLGVITTEDCDLGLIGYETTVLVERIGELLSPELISELKRAVAS